MVKNRVLLIGVDTSKIVSSNIPGYDPLEIHRQSGIACNNLILLGYDAKWMYLDITSTNAIEVLDKELNVSQFDCILIGAGIRKRPDQLRLFEDVINSLHQYAIGSRICFNEDVHDTVETVKRNLNIELYETNTK